MTRWRAAPEDVIFLGVAVVSAHDAFQDPVARAIREAIDAVAAPDVRVQILHRALHMAREHKIPSAGEPLQTFVEKHLLRATAFYLGEEAANSVMENLQQIVVLARALGSAGASPADNSTRKLGARQDQSGAHRRDPDTRQVGKARDSARVGSQPVQKPVRSQPALDEASALAARTQKYPAMRPAGTSLPMVLVASSDLDRCLGIEEHLEGAATVQQVQDVVSFLDTLKAMASLGPIVVVDCVQTSLQPTTLATIAHELPEESAVLLWGATDQHHRDLGDLVQEERGWLRCGQEASASDVAALIHMLIIDD